jgi:hypothetical protein
LALVLATLLGNAVFAGPQAAHAAPAPTPTIQIESHAQYISPNQINLVLDVSCDGTSGGSINAQVVQVTPIGTSAGSNYFSFVPCSNQPSKVVVPVYNTFYFPGWQLGKAQAAATICAFYCASDSRTIIIGS